MANMLENIEQLNINNLSMRENLLSKIRELPEAGSSEPSVDITPQVDENTTLISQVISELRGKAFTTTEVEVPGGYGDYVWKKYDWIDRSTITLSISQTVQGTPSKFLVESNDIDVSTIDVSFFEDFTGTGYYGGSDYPFWFLESKAILNGNSTTYSYDNSTCTLSLDTFKTNAELEFPDYVKEIPARIGEFVDFVISDNSTEYPNGGLHTDGYYYEKGESGSKVWKKTEVISEGGLISVTQLTSAVKPTQLQLSSNDIDLSKVDNSFFIGLTGQYATTPHTYIFEESNVFNVTSASTTFTYNYDPSTQILSLLDWSAKAVYDWTDIEFGAIYGKSNFVVNEDSSMYQNGEIVDGYYYDSDVYDFKNIFGLTELIEFDFIPASDTHHLTGFSLKKAPTFIHIWTDEELPDSSYSQKRIKEVTMFSSEPLNWIPISIEFRVEFKTYTTYTANNTSAETMVDYIASDKITVFFGGSQYDFIGGFTYHVQLGY